MEPNKFDSEIKQIVESRTIQPSEQAWDRLNSMLTVAEESKKKSKYNWIYIAASFMGFLLVSTVFFNGFGTKKISTDAPVVLEQKKEINSIEQAEVTNVDTMSSLNTKKGNKIKEVVAENNNQKTKSKQLKNKVVGVSIINQNRENVAVIVSSEKKNDLPKTNYKYVSAEELLAEVSNTNYKVKSADKRIETTRGTINVDAQSLLSDAETELNQSFRESAIEKLNKKYNVIKTVFVNRNYQE